MQQMKLDINEFINRKCDKRSKQLNIIDKQLYLYFKSINKAIRNIFTGSFFQLTKIRKKRVKKPSL